MNANRLMLSTRVHPQILRPDGKFSGNRNTAKAGGTFHSHVHSHGDTTHKHPHEHAPGAMDNHDHSHTQM